MRKKQACSHIRLICSFLTYTFALHSTNAKLCNRYAIRTYIAALNIKQPCNKRASYRLAYIVTLNKDPSPRPRPSVRDGLPHTNFPNKIFSTKFL